MESFRKQHRGRAGSGRRWQISSRLWVMALGMAWLIWPTHALGGEGGKQVAVLPFAIHAPQPLEHLREGLQAMLTSRLAKKGLPVLDPRVINRHPEAFRKAWEERDLVRVGKALKAAWVVAGSLTQVGTKGSLDIQVIKVFERKPPFFVFMMAEDMDLLGDALERVAVSVANEITGAVQVDSIEVQGNVRVEKDAILAVVQTAKGDVLDHEKLDRDLRAVYKMGYFKDVKIELAEGARGKRVIFRVTEKPSIGRIVFEGNKKIKDEELQGEVGLKRYAILDANAVHQGANRLKEFYRNKGYYDVEIEEKIEPLPNNEVLVKYVITEHEKVYVTKIEFVGNQRFDDGKLKGLMETRERGLLSWFTKSGYLDRKKLEYDVQKIAAFYHNHGYIRAVVADPVVTRDNGKGLKITIEIQEGPQYTVNNVFIKGDLIKPYEELLEHVQIRQKDVFNRETVRNDIAALKSLYADEGYAYAEVLPRTVEDDENHRVDIVFTITKGSKVRFERINITGNTTTRDKVIRRELKVVEGEYFSGRKLKKSAENLHRLGFFEDVQVLTQKGSSDEEMMLEVKVKERPTGSFSMGAGYSSVEKTFAVFEIAQNNFLGYGQKLSASARLGQISSEFDVRFVEPWLLDRPISTGVDLYRVEENDDNDEYTKESFGTAIRFSFPVGLDELTKGTFRYAYDDSDIRDVADTASIEIRDMEGRNVTSSATVGVTRDSRDRPWNTKRGSINTLTFEYAGGFLGGDVYFNKYFFRSAWFAPVLWDTIFMLQGRWGLIEAREGGKLPVYHKFRLGGINTVRGYDYRTISPVDPETGDRIGGEKMMVYNVEYRFPLVKQQGVVGLVFFDAGNVFTKDEDYTFSGMRKSFGGGVRWYSPVGPLRLEYGRIIDRQPGDPRGNWEFTVGGVF